MRTSGTTNELPEGLRLFFWEVDDGDLGDVLEEANFLSQVFDIDIYILESSRDCYHLKSYDVLSYETALSVQNWSILRGDYFPLDECGLYNRNKNSNTLRNISKGTKKRPRFIKVFKAKKNPHLLSLKHYQIDQPLAGLPDLDETDRKRAVALPVVMAIYNTGIGAKPKPTQF